MMYAATRTAGAAAVGDALVDQPSQQFCVAARVYIYGGALWWVDA